MADPLPRVLAGPIVRRIDPAGCSFWIATSVPARVTAKIWLEPQMAGGSPGTVASGNTPVASSPETELLKFGAKFYAGVVTIPLGETTPLFPGRIYSYDLVLSGDFGQSGLKQERLLEDEQAGSRLPGVDASAPLHKALGYIAGRLPSFVTPPAVFTTGGNLHLAHASCRKPNGNGPDALAWLDDVIEGHYNDAEQRLQQLFLTGDQIYADDLGACLLPMLNELGRDLLGREEDLPVSDTFTAPGTIANFPALRRARLVREVAKMSTSAGANHLVTFPEFIAMYLAAWSPRVWRPLAEDDDLFTAPPTENILENTFTDWEACYASAGTPAQRRAKWRQALEPSVAADRRQVEAYRASVPKVARALANTATYMIFDDHEITDDWNLNKRWRNRVYSTRIGRAIVRNGMMAYTLFQAWGNDPEEFKKADSQNKKLLDEIQKVLGTQPATDVNIPAVGVDPIDQMLGLVEPAKTVKWHYTVPGPLYRINVFDTRTQRKYSGEGIAPPDLVGGTLGAQLSAGPFKDGRELLLIVTPSPVLTAHIIESLAAPLFEMIGDFKYGFSRSANQDPCHPGGLETGVEAADAESWAANPPAREALLKQLAGYKQAVILSGDVHYAASLTLDYWSGNTPARIVQLISSSSRNGFSPTVEAILKSDALLQRYEQGLPPELLGWNDKSTLQLPAGAKIGPGRRARLNRKPALVPADGWPEGTTIPAEPAKQPNWRWRMKLVRDDRPDADLPSEGPHPPPYGGPELDPGNLATVIPAYSAIAARHQVAALTDGVVSLRQMVFTTNVGLVDISKKDGKYTVRHTLLSRSAAEPYRGVANTVHTISLAATSDAAPVLRTEG